MKNFLCAMLFLALLSSCGIFWTPRQLPKARFCYLDLKNKMICWNSEKYGSITQVTAFFYSKNKTRYDVMKEGFVSPESWISLAEKLNKADPAVFLSDTLYIWIWNGSPVIYDIEITVTPVDWKTKDKVYARWNAR